MLLDTYTGQQMLSFLETNMNLEEGDFISSTKDINAKPTEVIVQKTKTSITTLIDDSSDEVLIYTYEYLFDEGEAHGEKTGFFMKKTSIAYIARFFTTAAHRAAVDAAITLTN